ncbi:PPK2 family polyphosphate kinase [Mobilicoccus caccae]|uniref:Polyphosphate kinase-2-related domain-containing protein n=1 Tax=Mobilicoccus caccae TaxID=1859295 RepID=A0ABQ6IRL8_9MICO|nr:PPK2 family polyphosphate kinase [Mobilicoccus caccae]GMA39721.1 hypothetical protein GCM10025883_17660 [Mobilicoccus caccae]
MGKKSEKKAERTSAKKLDKKVEKKVEKKVGRQFENQVAEALRVGEGFRLADVDTSATPAFEGGKAEAEVAMAVCAAEVAELQERLYAASRGGDTRSVLLVIQGMDTSGKGGIMRHVVGLLDPQGVSITAFKKPTAQERRHPFLWRIRQALPEPGMIGVFDRSHYEDVLVARVDGLVPASTWRRRYSQIRTFEKSLTDSGTTIVKVMLHIGSQEQKERLGERLDRPDKYWKYNPGDVDVRLNWDAYQEAYAEALLKTSTDTALWYVVPADRKWYARLAVQQLLLGALREVDPQWPPADFDVEVEKARLAES